MTSTTPEIGKTASISTTDYHAKYYAYELTRRYASDRLEKLAQSLFNATVDLKPHQIDAALFAFRSPLSRGAILADEVGLGKTIEAGLIMAQLWAERKRRILCIMPSGLRKQWNRELIEKFYMESIILESGSYKAFVKEGAANPFDQDNKVVLCSYHFARTKQKEIANIPWDLVVVDEAHRLRNVYKDDNKIAKAIRDAIGKRPKVLLTATPLQNSLMELYGLVSFIDPHIFGDEYSFRSQFASCTGEERAPETEKLKRRISPICLRTLRRQVVQYIPYTNRLSITQDFTPSDDELRLYDHVSEYLQREASFALPSSQRSLLTLVLRKILASSSFAISDTLAALIRRLEKKRKELGEKAPEAPLKEPQEDFEGTEELIDEWEENEKQPSAPNPIPVDAVRKAMDQELAELKVYKTLAESITRNAKGEALLQALKTSFKRAEELGAPRKALIFTESRRTQRYLKELLSQNGYGGSIVTFSGTNSDPDSNTIYRQWKTNHEGEDTITGSLSADMRSALVEEFKDRASIMIATESGAEGINLQFCSLVVNYDLPWNPQRIEQRIGRCHRYGQKYDVVVVNFLNRRNAADQRVFELLAQKFKLFNGVFGASDEVLGALESGVDFEKRIHQIYQSCRTPNEINAAFDKLQADLDRDIQSTLKETRTKLLEHFDEEVSARLRLSQTETQTQMNRFEEWLWRLTQHALKAQADFDAENYRFTLKSLPANADPAKVPLGTYQLVTRDGAEAYHHYRLGHPLAETLLTQAQSVELPTREITFKYSDHAGKISVLEELSGQSGWIQLTHVSIQTLEREDYLLFSGLTDTGKSLDPDTCARFFSVSGETGKETMLPQEIATHLKSQFESNQHQIIEQIAGRNQTYFESEMEKLELWAEDLKDTLERELKDLEKEIRATRKETRQPVNLEAKVVLHKKIKDLEKKRNDKRRDLFQAQDEVETRKDTLIGEVESRLKQQINRADIFCVRWKVN